jgi:hypothetical protein
MRDYQHPWNLRRIFGSQPVGCVGNQSRPEAGIAAQIIPAQSSGWTVRGQGDGFWRPADLTTLVVDDNWGAGSRTLLRPQLRRFLYLQYQRRGFRLKPRLPSTPSIPKPEELSKRLLRCHSFESSCGRQIPFPLKTARNQKTSIKYE